MENKTETMAIYRLGKANFLPRHNVGTEICETFEGSLIDFIEQTERVLGHISIVRTQPLNRLQIVGCK